MASNMVAHSKLEPWAKKSLQGITFWTGHRHCLYEHYPLGESAFVAELCNLIFAHLDKTKYSLKCEVQYHELAKNLPKEIFNDRTRADIVIFNKQLNRDSIGVPANIIEVKRGKASNRLIVDDMLRLAHVNRKTQNCRTFLFVVCEHNRPKKFVTTKGTAMRGDHTIDGDPNSCYRVLRVFKAAHFFTGIEKAQYACCIEVFDRPPVAKK
jgi:hypothetical protein